MLIDFDRLEKQVEASKEAQISQERSLKSMVLGEQKCSVTSPFSSFLFFFLHSFLHHVFFSRCSFFQMVSFNNIMNALLPQSRLFCFGCGNALCMDASKGMVNLDCFYYSL